MSEPTNGQVIEQVAATVDEKVGAVVESVSATQETSNENTAWIIDGIKNLRGDLIERIDTSDRRTKEVFDQHEAKDQERFHKIDQVQGTLVAGQESMKGAVGVIEDRAVQLAEKRAKWLTWQQGVVLTLLSGGGIYVISHIHQIFG